MATYITLLGSLCIAASASSPASSHSSDSYSSSDTSWVQIFRCIGEPGSDVQFYGLDLEDIQSLIVESNPTQVQISGFFGSTPVTLTSKSTIQSIITETILNGRALSSFDMSQTSDWITEPRSFRRILSKSDDCSDKPGAYIPNIWYEACDNEHGLQIFRNGTESLCTFKEKYADSIGSDITISINSNALPTISDEYTPTVFDNADNFETVLAETLFPNMSFVSATQYIEMENTCLIDTRAEQEWIVSRIESAAVRIGWGEVSDGQITDSEIIDLVTNNCNDNDVIVLYCTLSYRAGLMGEYMINIGFDRERIKVLQGSISRWANERRHLVNNDGPTTFIHTFDPNNANTYVLTEYRYCC